MSKACKGFFKGAKQHVYIVVHYVGEDCRILYVMATKEMAETCGINLMLKALKKPINSTPYLTYGELSEEYEMAFPGEKITYLRFGVNGTKRASGDKKSLVVYNGAK